MPVTCAHPPKLHSQKSFAELDYIVMKHAFDIHNEMGNLWDEHDYQIELEGRCRKQGLETYTEVPVTVTYKEFSKTYFLDLLICGGVYELKTASAIVSRHETQTLGYLFLTDTHHGKIINFRQDSLTWRFVSTTLTHEDRLKYTIDAGNWASRSTAATDVTSCLSDLLKNWGAYLPIPLYKQAICHLLNLKLDHEYQRFIPVTTELILHLSGLNSRRNNLQNNLQKYLNRSEYKELLWINFNRNIIELACLNYSA